MKSRMRAAFCGGHVAPVVGGICRLAVAAAAFAGAGARAELVVYPEYPERIERDYWLLCLDLKLRQLHKCFTALLVEKLINV